MRDSHYPRINGYPADFFFLYNCDDQEFKISGFYEPTNSSGFNETIIENEIVRIWELADSLTPSNSLFPTAFWSDCLVLLRKNNNPKLVWSGHPSFSTTHYKIYRAVSTLPLSHPELFANLIATVNSSTFDYRDINISFSGSDYIYYFLKAYNSTNSSYSSRTNIVNTKGGFYKQNEENSNLSEEVYNYNLLPIYPNPFNPSTSITYQLPNKGHVVLKVYNTLGKEVVELVNEIKEEGAYSVTFNGDNLPNGMFFYKIQSGEFVDVKKMLLLK